MEEKQNGGAVTGGQAKDLYGWKLNAYELSWLFGFSAVAVATVVLQKGNVFGLSVLVTGLLCVLLAAKGHLHTYIFGMYNSVAYAWLAYTNGLYGEMGLNLFFFLPMNIVGFVMWKQNTTQHVVRMRGLSVMVMAAIFVLCLVLTAGLGWVLSWIEGQNTPYIDATTNVLSVIATFLMVLRYREQWVLYILLNIFTILMWALRSLDGSLDGWLMMLMWFAYLINAVYGCRIWYRSTSSAQEIVA